MHVVRSCCSLGVNLFTTWHFECNDLELEVCDFFFPVLESMADSVSLMIDS